MIMSLLLYSIQFIQIFNNKFMEIKYSHIPAHYVPHIGYSGREQMCNDKIPLIIQYTQNVHHGM
jgi:hypothetical protein